VFGRKDPHRKGLFKRIRIIGRKVKMSRLANIAGRVLVEECGQDLIEYALLAALIALACTAALQSIGANIVTIFTTVNSSI
jgi:pilus assembly protein Flp/PilA